MAMLIVSALVRVIERFQMTEYLVDPQSQNYGLIIGSEITITWGCLLVAEWLIAMKFFDVANQVPAVISGQRNVHEIRPRGSMLVKILGSVANIAVSIWPGVLFATTYYNKGEKDVS